jgi:hypothetical protein
MQRVFIIAVNCVLLVVALLGVHEVAGVQVWHWQISSLAAARSMMFWELALSAVLNAVAARFVVKGRKERHLCWLWVAIFAALLGGEYAYERGYFNFEWLKRSLVWIANKL